MLFHIFCDLFGNLRVNSRTVKERAYSSLVRPKPEYSNCVWDPHTKSQIHVPTWDGPEQSRAATWARYTNRYHNTSSVTEMLQTLNWPTLEKRRIRTRIIFLYKIIHRSFSDNFSKYRVVSYYMKGKFVTNVSFATVRLINHSWDIIKCLASCFIKNIFFLRLLFPWGGNVCLYRHNTLNAHFLTFSST